ncbi:MAG TPA: hypothetical protein VGM54_05855 [Chthoniobacter sp.]|jgi:hypothetical protein
MKNDIFLGAAALLLLSLSAGAQTVIRESTTTVPAAPVPVAPAATTTTTVQPVDVAGTITEFTPDALMVRAQDAAAPMRYTFSKTTEYLDDAGNRVSRSVVRTGAPVTISYVREGDRMLVNRVIVHHVAVAPEAVTTERTTTTTTTTTTTEEKHHQHDKD